MAKALRKTLPKDLPQLMKAAAQSGDYREVHAALETCAVDARGGHADGTALMMSECTPELARWLVARGLDVNAADKHGQTALHQSARARFFHSLPVETLLALGADVHAITNDGRTPLHAAADGKHLHAVELLVRNGAQVDSRTRDGLTPLEYALLRMTNLDFPAMVLVVEALLRAGAEVSVRAREFVEVAAKRFEFHRASIVADKVEALAEACAVLCALAGVTAPGPRRVHDGTSPIVATGATWQARHAELWDLLVPSSGACRTVQGEVIRIAGRISDEIHRNGGANWDADYRAMLQALAVHASSHAALDDADQTALRAAIGQLPQDAEATRDLARLAVAWVDRNPTPLPLAPPGYRR
ncbi:ankyrin repeat domain-containing protein [Nannocystis sp. SCPEA4]|uniref:ankyrin repeat domain-containing protein n=1 Tax=Nannocystis sp. SCPEA4 TaxID=2996787 RepID=UPI00227221FD|nr:ankyrin repeat domain-containing protein [Nannocystis sp. SCPEA4]MCY1055639.1 ankyrin repeat domain-containing protein [Nannocystis sp. SCPEA4]